MPREQIHVDIPEEWNENMRHGRCWCGKIKTKFEKGQKYYCSKAHAAEYSKRITFWSSFKREILEEQGERCKKCGRDRKQFEKDRDKFEKKIILEESKKYPKAVHESRSVMLVELQKNFENIMTDEYVFEHMDWQLREKFAVPSSHDLYDHQFFHVEVDHIKAVALGGKMWDKKNLQVLCSDCHKIKTKDDMNKIKFHRRSKGTETLVESIK